MEVLFPRLLNAFVLCALHITAQQFCKFHIMSTLDSSKKNVKISTKIFLGINAPNPALIPSPGNTHTHTPGQGTMPPAVGLPSQKTDKEIKERSRKR